MAKKVKKIQKKAKKAPKKVTNAPRIQPLGDRILVRPFTEEALRREEGERHFGIILPESVSKEKSAEGTVLAVGKGRYEDGKLRPLSVSVGDRVIFSKYGYDEVKDGAEELYILKEDAVLAIIRR